MRRLMLTALLALTACPNVKLAEQADTKAATAKLVADGKLAMKKGDFTFAIKAFKEAISNDPNDANSYLLLAEAYQRSGEENGAYLTIKQAEEVSGASNPTVKRARADLWLKMNKVPQAVQALVSLRNDELLTDEDILQLAQFQGAIAQPDAARESLAVVRKHNPDLPDITVIEAELLRIAGDEADAVKKVDDLLEVHRDLTRARLWRANYYLSSGKAELARKDLQLVAEGDSHREDVVRLMARTLNELGRYEEAAGVLQQIIDDNPGNGSALALLAETRLLQGKGEEAQSLADRALAFERLSPQVRYVRGRAHEQQGQLDRAMDEYREAVHLDPLFAPALSHQWKLFIKNSQPADAIAALEKLFQTNQASEEEKQALAKLYFEANGDRDRARKLIAEGLRRDPKSPDWLALQKATTPKQTGTPGVQIIRGKR